MAKYSAGCPTRECAHDDAGADVQQVAVKLSPEGDRLITSGARYLRMSRGTSLRPLSSLT